MGEQQLLTLEAEGEITSKEKWGVSGRVEKARKWTSHCSLQGNATRFHLGILISSL